jgi:transcriptional regulator with XRE-family HTH domain
MTSPRVGPRERERLLRAISRHVGRQISDLRTDAGVTRAELARCAGIDPSHVWRIEAGETTPSLDVLVRVSACLGSDLGVRMFPTAGPRLHDRFQAPMIEALLASLGPQWQGRPEVPVPAARGVVDAVLSRELDGLTLVCECHSELRRLELALRRLAEKAAALRGQLDPAATVSTLLLLRSTAATRSIARAYEATLTAAFPARSRDALAALRGDAAWPGSAIVWSDVGGGRAEILDRPPRGVRLGR